MKSLLILIFLAGSPTAFAQLDAASEQATKQTQDLLKSQAQRQKYIDETPDAKRADDKAQEVAGSNENKDQMYNISAGITRTLAERNNGDANKMKADMDKAAADPEGFYNGLTPEQRQQIDALSGKIESERPAGLNHP